MQTKAFNAEIRLFPLKGACNAVLGMHNKKIQDSSITASSQLSLNHVPSLARLDSVQGAWCSAPTDNLTYIEILLSEEKFLTLIKTQGSKKDLRWATKYEIQYQKDGQWIVYRKTDGTRVSNKQTNPVCYSIRISVFCKHNEYCTHNAICMPKEAHTVRVTNAIIHKFLLCTERPPPPYPTLSSLTHLKLSYYATK